MTLQSLPQIGRAQNSAPVVTNVTAAQLAGTGQVRITYTVSDAEGDSVTPRVVCSSNNGTTFDLLPVSVSGDVNRRIAPGGPKQILWDAARDYPGRYWAQVVAKVYASDRAALGGQMVSVPSGTFVMGSTSGNGDEQPQHTVSLDAFLIDKYEVTNAEFQQFIDAGGYTTQAFWSTEGWNWRNSYGNEPFGWTAGSYNNGPGFPSFPVNAVSWYEAEAYANFVGKRLPTEAEWEKAARGTDARTYPWGENINASRATYNNGVHPYTYSTPVGFYDGTLWPNPPNSPFQTTNSPGPYGTYDQAGNVSEWVHDFYDPGYYASSPSSNPPGPAGLGPSAPRVLRGGSWNIIQDYVRCAGRLGQNAYFPDNNFVSTGFRCAKTAP